MQIDCYAVLRSKHKENDEHFYFLSPCGINSEDIAIWYELTEEDLESIRRQDQEFIYANDLKLIRIFTKNKVTLECYINTSVLQSSNMNAIHITSYYKPVLTQLEKVLRKVDTILMHFISKKLG